MQTYIEGLWLLLLGATIVLTVLTPVVFGALQELARRNGKLSTRDNRSCPGKESRSDGQ